MPVREPIRPSLFLAGSGELALRVRGREHDGRLIRLRSPKCTIGSAAGCTLRLRAAGVAPLHCWVLRGPAGTIVRRLHGQLTVNGGAQQEAALAPGDRLRLGAVELEVVECNQRPAAAAEMFAVPPADTAELQREVAAALEKIARLEGESRQGWQSSITAADRADQLRTALANAHQQLEDACRELTASQATMQRQTQELHTLEAALSNAEHAAAGHNDLVSRLQMEAAALHDEHNRCQTELTDLRAALGGALEERARLTAIALESEQKLSAQHELLQQRLAQRDAELSAIREQAAAEAGGMTVAMEQLRRTVDMSQNQGQVQCAKLEQQLAATQAELSANQQAAAQAQEAAAQAQRALACEQESLAAVRLQATERSAAWEQERAALLQQLEERQQALAVAATSAQEAADIGARCEQLQARLLSAQQDLSSAQEQMSAVTAAASAQEEVARQAAELAQGRQALEQQAAEVTQQRQSLEQRAAEQQDAALRLQERGQQLEQHTHELEENLRAAQAKLQEVDALRAALALDREALAERERQLAERERQLAECERKVAEREVQLAQPPSQSPLVTQPFAEIAEEAAASECDNSHELREQLAAAEAGRKQLAEQVENLELRCRELEEQRRSALAQAAAAYRDAEPAADEPAGSAEPDGRVEPEGGRPVNMTAAFPVAAPADPTPQNERLRDSDEVDSVLNRLVRSGVWREELAAAEPEASAAAPEPAAIESAPATASAAAEKPDDDSIDNYMDLLLKRVRGESATNAGGWKQNLPANATVAPSASVAASPAEVTPQASASVEEKYVPRTTAPEQTLGLSAMRDLANTTARAAIDTHIRKHTGRQAVGRLFTAILILAISGTVSIWARWTHSLPAGVAGGIGAALGLLGTLAALRRMLSVMRLNRPQTSEQPAAPANEPAAGS